MGLLLLESYSLSDNERLEKPTPVSLSDMYKLADEVNQVQTDLMASILTPLLPAIVLTIHSTGNALKRTR